MFNLTSHPKAWTVTIEAESEFGDTNRIVMPENSAGTQGVATSIQVINNSDGTAVQVQFNDDPDSTFTLDNGDIMSFGHNEIHVEVVDFQIVLSGGETATMTVIAGVEYA